MLNYQRVLVTSNYWSIWSILRLLNIFKFKTFVLGTLHVDNAAIFHNGLLIRSRLQLPCCKEWLHSFWAHEERKHWAIHAAGLAVHRRDRGKMQRNRNHGATHLVSCDWHRLAWFRSFRYSERTSVYEFSATRMGQPKGRMNRHWQHSIKCFQHLLMPRFTVPINLKLEMYTCSVVMKCMSTTPPIPPRSSFMGGCHRSEWRSSASLFASAKFLELSNLRLGTCDWRGQNWLKSTATCRLAVWIVWAMG